MSNQACLSMSKKTPPTVLRRTFACCEPLTEGSAVPLKHLMTAGHHLLLVQLVHPETARKSMHISGCRSSAHI